MIFVFLSHSLKKVKLFWGNLGFLLEEIRLNSTVKVLFLFVCFGLFMLWLELFKDWIFCEFGVCSCCWFGRVRKRVCFSINKTVLIGSRFSSLKRLNFHYCYWFIFMFLNPWMLRNFPISLFACESLCSWEFSIFLSFFFHFFFIFDNALEYNQQIWVFFICTAIFSYLSYCLWVGYV